MQNGLMQQKNVSADNFAHPVSKECIEPFHKAQHGGVLDVPSRTSILNNEHTFLLLRHILSLLSYYLLHNMESTCNFQWFWYITDRRGRFYEDAKADLINANQYDAMGLSFLPESYNEIDNEKSNGNGKRHNH